MVDNGVVKNDDKKIDETLLDDNKKDVDIFSDDFVGLPIPEYVEPTPKELHEEIKEYLKRLTEYINDIDKMPSDFIEKNKGLFLNIRNSMNNALYFCGSDDLIIEKSNDAVLRQS